jgi:hypothetical protein
VFTQLDLLPQTSEDITLAPPTATAALNLGFLTVLRESNGYVGGYLVTNQWGRPVEFRLSTAVQPNRVQQILYAETLEPYICGDLIGKTLVEKTGTPVQMIITDTEAALDLRQRVEMPVALLTAASAPTDPPAPPAPNVRGHARFPGDGPVIRDMLETVKGTLDLAEPFTRIREAMGEARKLGVTNRG